MKKITIISALLTVISLSAQANTIERCFNAGGGKVGRITMTENSLIVDYDLADKAGNTVMSSNFLENIKRTETSISADAFMMGTGDGSDFRFTIRKDSVSIQALWSNGTPIRKPNKLAIVQCP